MSALYDLEEIQEFISKYKANKELRDLIQEYRILIGEIEKGNGTLAVMREDISFREFVEKKEYCKQDVHNQILFILNCCEPLIRNCRKKTCKRKYCMQFIFELFMDKQFEVEDICGE